jgi:peptide/nickel transport system ATP-binding protein
MSLDEAAMVTATRPLLSVHDLTVDFRTADGWRPAARNVSFALGQGETLAIVGESGSGKSVTALSIMRLLSGAAVKIGGKIVFADRDLLALSEPEMRAVRGNQIAMIFQEPMTSLNPVLSIGRQITEALRFHRKLSSGEAEAEAIRALERVRIPAARSRYHEHPHSFSGGMRQRVMIAIALACKPRLLIADEPTTALDVTIQAQILELIKELQAEEQMSVLFITHDMGVVAEVADHTLVMQGGEAVERGETRAVFEAPAHPYTRALLSAVPKLGSMSGQLRPRPFPIVDKITGRITSPPERPDTVVTLERPVLEVQNLTTRFEQRTGLFGRLQGRVHAVENVSFSLQPGETLAVVGESGCGKSTTGRSILRLVQPDSGRILIDGIDVSGNDHSSLQTVRRTIQTVFQDPFASLNPRIPIGAAIAEPILLHRLASRVGARNRVAALLHRVGLEPEMMSRYPHEFSGGQRQRICIARALALEPRVIIADEAVSALDVSVKAQIINLLLELQATSSLSFLFISHDMAVVERLSHRVAVMHLGEIVEIGSRAAIFENPQHSYTRKLIEAVPIPDPQRRRARRSVPDGDISNPTRPAHYVPPRRSYREVSIGHLVQIEGMPGSVDH